MRDHGSRTDGQVGDPEPLRPADRKAGVDIDTGRHSDPFPSLAVMLDGAVGATGRQNLSAREGAELSCTFGNSHVYEFDAGV
jgi:hypothetical protein